MILLAAGAAFERACKLASVFGLGSEEKEKKDITWSGRNISAPKEMDV